MAVITEKAVVATIARAKKVAGRVVVKDDEEAGLMLVVGPTGAARWAYEFRRRGLTPEGKRHLKRQVTIGRPPLMSVAAARFEVRRTKAAVAEGRDPAAERNEANRRAALEAARDEMLSAAAERHIAALTGSPKHVRTEAGMLRRSIDEIGDRRISELTRGDVRRLVDMHRDRPGTCRHRVGALGRFCQRLLDEEKMAANPCAGIRLPKPPAPRTGKPSAIEVQALWRAAGGLGDPRGRFLQAMILCPLRLGEMAELRPENVRHNGDGPLIDLGHLQTKNGDPFLLPIPTTHASLFEASNTLRVFGLTRDPAKPFLASKALTAAVRKRSGVASFRWHDLRRLFVSECAEHGIGSADVLDVMLNHRAAETRGGVRAHYHQAGLGRQKRDVIEAWATLVIHAVEHGCWPREMTGDAKIVEMADGASSR